MNENLLKCNIYESDSCQCGQIESVKHYLMKCELYENEREEMRRKFIRHESTGCQTE